MYITLPNKDYKSSDVTLADILGTMKKTDMLKICKKLDLYVSPNLRKDETARRLAEEMLNYPEAILCALSKTELQLLDEIVKAGASADVPRKKRKMPYMLQKLGLVITYDKEDDWQMLMPDKVRESLADLLPDFMKIIEDGLPTPTYKQLRMMEAMDYIMGKYDKE